VRFLELDQVGSEEFNQLKTFPNLEQLVIRSPKTFTIDDAKKLQSLIHLKSLSLLSLPSTTEFKRLSVVTESVQLSDLQIEGWFSSEELELACARCASLETLTCPSAIFRAETATVLEKSTKIKALELHGSFFEDQLDPLPSIRTLEHLRLVGDVGRKSEILFRSLARMNNLCSLVLPRGLDCSLESVSILSKLKRLTSLDISDGRRLGETLAKALRECEALKFLIIFNCDVYDAFFTGLAGENQLESLQVLLSRVIGADFQNHASDPNDAWLGGISQLGGLRSLLLDGCRRVSSEGFSQLKGLRNLKSLRLTECHNLDDGALAALTTLPNLASFELWEAKNVSGTGFASIARLKQLQTLTLYKCKTLKLTAFETFASKNIRELSLDRCSALDADDLRVIVQLKSLEVLSLRGVRGCNGDSISKLAKELTELRELDLSFTDIGDDALNSLKGAKRLRVLSISSCRRITFEAAAKLLGKFKLAKLYVYGDIFNSEQLMQLRKGMPDCEFYYE